MSDLEKKVILLETENNMLGNYGRQNTKFIGIPASMSDNQLENKVFEIFPGINVEVLAMAFKTATE